MLSRKLPIKDLQRHLLTLHKPADSISLVSRWNDMGLERGQSRIKPQGSYGKGPSYLSRALDGL